MAQKRQADPVQRHLPLPTSLYVAMVAHARRESPNEACGFLAGMGGVPVRVIPARNAAEHPVVRYSIPPKDIIAFDRQLEEHNWQWVGIYHSHTFSEAYPSPTDIANAITALYPDLLYIILSLRSENFERQIAAVEVTTGTRLASFTERRLRPPEIRAFTINDGVVEEVRVDLV